MADDQMTFTPARAQHHDGDPPLLSIHALSDVYAILSPSTNTSTSSMPSLSRSDSSSEADSITDGSVDGNAAGLTSAPAAPVSTGTAPPHMYDRPRTRGKRGGVRVQRTRMKVGATIAAAAAAAVLSDLEDGEPTSSVPKSQQHRKQQQQQQQQQFGYTGDTGRSHTAPPVAHVAPASYHADPMYELAYQEIQKAQLRDACAVSAAALHISPRAVSYPPSQSPDPYSSAVYSSAPVSWGGSPAPALAFHDGAGANAFGMRIAHPGAPLSSPPAVAGGGGGGAAGSWFRINSEELPPLGETAAAAERETGFAIGAELAARMCALGAAQPIEDVLAAVKRDRAAAAAAAAPSANVHLPVVERELELALRCVFALRTPAARDAFLRWRTVHGDARFVADVKRLVRDHEAAAARRAAPPTDGQRNIPQQQQQQQRQTRVGQHSNNQSASWAAAPPAARGGWVGDAVPPPAPFLPCARCGEAPTGAAMVHGGGGGSGGGMVFCNAPCCFACASHLCACHAPCPACDQPILTVVPMRGQ
ncbi:hypothetical protein JKP88DRAFT_330410 [Tribonema minus]|uniref:Uncharacterized protein n=1 Tax=Tribonema minus TaxID=303371 RepID=A0A836CBG5_9STRA|nr:hypothetical protein JKP88DRAFT_330410 [Tribonema minus]